MKYFIIIILLIGVCSCKPTQSIVRTNTQVNNTVVSRVYVHNLPMDTIVSMFREDVKLVKTEVDFKFLVMWYKDVVTNRLYYNERDVTLFYYVIKEEEAKFNFKF